MNLQKNILLITIVFIAVFFHSCGHQAEYENTLPIPEEGWKSDQWFIFEVNIENLAVPYDFYVNIRNNEDYAFSNFYLFLKTTFPDQSVSMDTLEFILADKTGKWLGKGTGRVRENDFFIRNNIIFQDTGTYLFSLQQGMRSKILTGIEDIGIRIEKSNPAD